MDIYIFQIHPDTDTDTFYIDPWILLSLMKIYTDPDLDTAKVTEYGYFLDTDTFLPNSATPISNSAITVHTHRTINSIF